MIGGIRFNLSFVEGPPRLGGEISESRGGYYGEQK